MHSRTRLSSADAATTTASNKRGSDPRRLRQLLRGELDWIVMKCLEKDRNRRYETANGLCSDLFRYLKNEPVHACPPSVAYRFRVFTRRNKASIVTAGLLLGIAVIGTALTVWQAVRAASARDTAVQAQLALSATRQAAAEERANAIARDLETLNKANSLIESGRNHVDFAEWEKAEADLSSAVRLRPDHSSVWRARGDLYARLNLWDLAAADFQEAAKLQEPASLNSLYLQSLLRLSLGDTAGYRQACERMVHLFDNPKDPRAWEKEEIARACLLQDVPILGTDRLVQLTQRAHDSGRTAMRLTALGTACYRAGLYETAMDRLEQARATTPQWETSWADSVLAMLHHRRGRAELARKALESAARSLGNRFVLRSQSPGAFPNAQWWYEAQGDLCFREAKQLIEGENCKEDPWVLSDRSDCPLALGKTQEAIASLDRAIELNPEFLVAYSQRAELHSRRGDWQSAFQDYERIRAIKPDQAEVNNQLACVIFTCPVLKYRDSSRAVQLAEKAVAVEPNVGICWNTLGLARYRANDWSGGAKAILKSMEFNHANDVRDWLILAMCEWRQDQKGKAKQLFLFALRRIAVNGSQVEYVAKFRDEASTLIGQPEASLIVPATGEQEDPSAYSLLMEIEPAVWAYELRGTACAHLKQWDQAAADLARATELHLENFRFWYAQAAARIGARDLEGYRKVRAEIFSRFRDVKTASPASHLSYISVVTPVCPGEVESLLRLSQVAGGTSSNPRVQGAANYRAGKYEAAIADLNKSANSTPRRAWDWLFLAMAHHKLGHTEEAKNYLQKAAEWIEQTQRTRSATMTNPWVDWYEPVEVDQLLREAKEMIH